VWSVEVIFWNKHLFIAQHRCVTHFAYMKAEEWYAVEVSDTTMLNRITKANTKSKKILIGQSEIHSGFCVDQHGIKNRDATFIFFYQHWYFGAAENNTFGALLN